MRKAVLMVLPMLLAGCGMVPPSESASESAPPVATVVSPTPSATPTPTPALVNTIPAATLAKATPTPTPTPSPSASALPLAGKVIVVDPGHNGKYKKSYNTKKVPAGNGKKKPCNSSGTATNDGWAEHAYTWTQSQALKKELEALGAKVVLTRQNDNGLGPCVNERAAVANKAKADLSISIHADGSYAKNARGYHIIISTTMDGGSKLEKASLALAEKIRTEMDKTDMPRSTYTGKGTAFSKRSDIGGLNLLKTTPGIMMEMGNMRNAKDVKLLKSASFRKAAAKALAQAAVKALQ
ncbi:MAG: N-acetylmuramoyl-L-alanine amidase [Propionibacteriaceae bacterium]|nr:N-acetylmuramoyl-L-alanine amidase [Propionibacteriaceae bacterium]